jgi:hypothetical protein
MVLLIEEEAEEEGVEVEVNPLPKILIVSPNVV